MAASGHDLRKCLAVFHPFRFPLSDKFPFGFRFRGLAACAMFFNCFVLGIKDFPAVAYAQLVAASEMSCCTWKRSLIREAPGKAVRTVSIIAEDKSVVTVFTLHRSRSGIFLSTPDTVSVATPRIMAASAPLPPWAALLVSMV